MTAGELYTQACTNMRKYRQLADQQAWVGLDYTEAERLCVFWQQELLQYAHRPHDEFIPDH
jgi:hypothetical protein